MEEWNVAEKPFASSISNVKYFDHVLTTEEMLVEMKKAETERDYWISRCRNCDTVFNVHGNMDPNDFPSCCDSPDITVYAGPDGFNILLITMEND
jgi:hypothetical protein